MKTVVFTLFLMTSATGRAGKPNPADFPITVHVRSAHLVDKCDILLGHMACETDLHLGVLIDGKAFELINQDRDYPIHIGDYKAKLKPVSTSLDGSEPPAYENHQKYQILFSDGKTLDFKVIGESE